MSEDSYTDDDKWLVVKGRRWRRTDPELEATVVDELKSRLGKARNAVRTTKKNGTEEDLKEARRLVDIAKHGLGERGDHWWEMSVESRRKRAEEALTQLRRPQPSCDDLRRSDGRGPRSPRR